MTPIDELYAKRQAFLEYGASVPEKLTNEIREAENCIYSDTILLTYCNMPRKAETETKGSFTVMVEYRDDCLVNVGVRKDLPVENNADIFITLEKAKELLGETDDDIDVVSEKFLDPTEILRDADGVEFAVCNEWGDNYEGFRKHIEESFGWKLEEVV